MGGLARWLTHCLIPLTSHIRWTGTNIAWPHIQSLKPPPFAKGAGGINSRASSKSLSWPGLLQCLLSREEGTKLGPLSQAHADCFRGGKPGLLPDNYPD